MKAIMIMFDSLNRSYLPNYGCDWTKMPNFKRLGEKVITFDNFYGGSMPCMPTRRELHTGRYNFLHTSWCPLQPFDDSIISRMKKSNIYTHISTDHFHYWEDGGSCYLTKYDSHDIIRGQQGDPWKGEVQWPKFPETLSRRKYGQSWRHDWINRKFISSENDMPQKKTFDCGINFIQRNLDKDNWFLQIEAFDPHEPFYSMLEYKNLYPHEYTGKNLDWPDYGKNDYGLEATEHVKLEYAALMSMCDKYLGYILDLMDKYDMWKDTMLIVNTDHGFMLGEKEWMGKNIQPFYNELIHLPFFIHDPRNPHPGERRKALAQTIDITATLAEFFNINPPEFMDGYSLTPIIKDDIVIREGALFGIFGSHVNITDGNYVYMHAPISFENSPLYEYTLMPCHMNTPFSLEELRNVELAHNFPFTKKTPVLKIKSKSNYTSYLFGTNLFDLKNDPFQERPINNFQEQKRLLLLMRKLMLQNHCPDEQFIRLGIPKEGEIDISYLKNYITERKLPLETLNYLTLEGAQSLALYSNILSNKIVAQIKNLLSEKYQNSNHSLGSTEVKEIVYSLLEDPLGSPMIRLVEYFINKLKEGEKYEK